MLLSSIPYSDRNAFLKVSEKLLSILPEDIGNIVPFCIGTDRITGDAYGPLVGTFLKGYGLSPVGTLDEPVHAGNLADFHSKLPRDSYVLAIDACLGSTSSIGKINFYRGPISPGAGVGKDLELVGDLAITMTVNVGGFMENMVLANTRLSLVYSGAQVTALGIYRALSIRGLTKQERLRNQR